MGYRMVVLSEHADDSGRWADHHVIGDTRDPGTVRHEVARQADVLTNEFEQVPPEVLQAAEAVGEGCRVAPGSHVQETCRDRRGEKAFFATHGFPVGPFAGVERAGKRWRSQLLRRLSAGTNGEPAKGVVAKTSARGIRRERARNGLKVLSRRGMPGSNWGCAADARAGRAVCRGGQRDCARSCGGASWRAFPCFAMSTVRRDSFQTVVPGGFSEGTERQARAVCRGHRGETGRGGAAGGGDVCARRWSGADKRIGGAAAQFRARDAAGLHAKPVRDAYRGESAICRWRRWNFLRPGVMTNLLGIYGNRGAALGRAV